MHGINIPILRKDFIIEEYQLIESKAIGADIILLIAACLTKAEVKQLATFAKKLGLNVLLEIHGEIELDHDVMKWMLWELIIVTSKLLK